MDVSERRSIAKKSFSLKAAAIGMIFGFFVIFIIALIGAALINSEKLSITSQKTVCLIASAAGFIAAAIMASNMARSKRFITGLLSCCGISAVMFLIGFCFENTLLSASYLIYILLETIICSLLGSTLGAAFSKSK